MRTMWKITAYRWQTSTQTETRWGYIVKGTSIASLTLLGSSCTKPSTTGMRDEAATALTSSSRSCRPTVMAGSTRGSNTEIRSWDTKEQMDKDQHRCTGMGSERMAFTVTSLHKEHICFQAKKKLFAHAHILPPPQFKFMTIWRSNRIHCRSLLCLFNSSSYTNKQNRWYLSDSQGILDPKQAAMTNLPLVFFQQLQQDVYCHGNTRFIHVAEGHTECLGTRLPDRSHHLAKGEIEDKYKNGWRLVK